jgi:hypothetical protein
MRIGKHPLVANGSIAIVSALLAPGLALALTCRAAVGLFLLTVLVLAAAGPATAYTGQELARDAKNSA